jgi:hypothetical protein
MAEAKQLGEDVEARVRSAVSGEEEAWRKHYSWTEHEMRIYSENVNAAFQNDQTQVYYLPFLYYKQYVFSPPDVNILYN